MLNVGVADGTNVTNTASVTSSTLDPNPGNNFFFFQAEDGIRDDLVTGVQTCALPISRGTGRRRGRRSRRRRPPGRATRAGRSEERRVGKECRSGWAPDQLLQYDGRELYGVRRRRQP